ncbi:Lactoylglutathione lyase [Symbiodinium microadriaticum]|uniref:Lactoylglutathione lyase n=1 Tax=Symbiodinium microadriaticum TaxID=2951 RepID=A0A1Q9DXA7_SYMMI|nr:Lactoylglutathione lyase [Symbiodinium microadriaticum]CAE7345485.1 GLYI-11 [Symbiodinium sp. KB8]
MAQPALPAWHLTEQPVVRAQVALKTSRSRFPSARFSGSAALATFAAQLAIRRCAKGRAWRSESRILRAAADFSENKMLHAMLHVRDLDDSLAFYEALGLRTLSCNRRPSGGGTAFVGPGKLRDKENFALELASAKDPDKPLQQGGFQGLVISGGPGEKVDPNGYPMSFSESGQQGSVLSLRLQTSNLRDATDFYEQLGMKVVGKDAGTASLAYASGPQTMLTLKQIASEVGPSTGFDHLVVSTADVEDATSALETVGVKVLMPPTNMFGMNIAGFVDCDGYKIYLVKESDFQQD